MYRTDDEHLQKFLQVFVAHFLPGKSHRSGRGEKEEEEEKTISLANFILLAVKKKFLSYCDHVEPFNLDKCA